MQQLLQMILRLSKLTNVIAGIALSFMVLITVGDVILRSFRKPIPGTYELVAFLGLAAIGFSLPFTQWVKGHISVDFLVLKFSGKVRKAINLSTRCVGVCFFFVSGWYLIRMGMKLYRTGQVSLTLQMPYYPLAYGVGICFFVLCLVLLSDIVKILEDKNE